MIYIILFLLSFTLTYLIRSHALKKSLLALPNERSSHTVPTPHGGGIAIALTWFIGLSYLYFQQHLNPSLYYALLLGSILATISYLDDLFDLNPKIRLLTQSIVAIGGIFAIGGLNEIDLGIWIITNPFLTNLFAFLLIVWFINLYNFLDGIDGYAGSEAIFLALLGFLLFEGEHFLILIAAVSGFLLWNWDKAKIFMGDVGSTLLGYTMAILTLYYANQASQNLWSWIILFGLFWFDATLTLFRRYRNNEKLSQAHRKHCYQRITQSGWTHQKTVLVACGINILSAIPLFWISNTSALIGYLLFYLSILYLIVRHIDKQKPFR